MRSRPRILRGFASLCVLVTAVISVLQAAPPPQAPPGQGPEGGQRYYINDIVGIKILLPPEWQVHEQEGDSTHPVIIVLNRPGTLARVVLTREILEASHEIHKNLLKKHFSDNTQDYRELGEEKVNRSGMDGTRMLISMKADEIRYRQWVLLVSSDNNHYRVVAQVPEELFDRYQETFQQMMDSVEFPSVANPAQAEVAAAGVTAQSSSEPQLHIGSGRITGVPSGDEISWLRERIAQNPNDAEAHTNLGNALDDSGDTDGAIAEYKTAVLLAPDDARAHRNLGVAYVRKDDWETAESEFRQAVRLDPSYVIGRMALIDALVRKDDFEEAFNQYHAAIRTDRWRVFGILFNGQSVPPELQQDFDRVPSEAAAHFLVAVRLTIKKQDHQKIIRELEEAIRIAPEFRTARKAVAEITGK